jgi:predicted helicase
VIEGYLREIKKIYEKGDTREESFYPILSDFLSSFSKKYLNFDIDVRILPKQTEAGNPDIKIWKGKNEIIGYIEVKDLSKDNLSEIEKSEQLERYRKAFPNLILTNLFEFRLYRNGNLVDKMEIIRSYDLLSLNVTQVTRSKEEEIKNFFNKFFSFALPQSFTPEEIAKALANKTKMLKWVVYSLLNEGEKFLQGLYESFEKYLITGIGKDDFCDLYAQTLTYGLFTARLRCKNEFDRREAFYVIPKTFGILRDIFRIISLEDIPEQMEWIIDDIAYLLAHVDVNDIFEKYKMEKKGEDPVIYFYENFLTEYDPKEREKRGVYYTPHPVVSYIVRSLNMILKDKFGISDGFSDKSVTVLDPAGGTLSFLEEAIKIATDEFKEKYGEGSLKGFIKDHILHDFYAFELMMAPYVIGHMRLSFLLTDYGYELSSDERIKYYLTNTLDMNVISDSAIPIISSISDESKNAEKVKKEIPILVIMGNPPYSGISANNGEWIEKLLKEDFDGVQSYYKVDGKSLNEKKLWLQDDYVKFIRFAQWKINQAGEGVLGFITNHGYLDNPTFRGMRQSLMKTFNEIYILDLHGNSLKKERCPDGSKDENVFDIRQGVAIGLFIKKKDAKDSEVYHSEEWELREKKYEFLLANDIKTTQWKKLEPNSPYYFFSSRDEKGREIYESFMKVTEIFPVNCVGIVTARDKFVIDFDKETLRRRIAMFRNLSIPDETVKQTFKLKDTSTFKFRKSREILSKDEKWSKYFTEILYRPFDKRNIYYTNIVVERPLFEVMRHMMQENLGILFTRPQSPKYEFSVFASDKIADQCVAGNKSAGAGISYIVPLYLYPFADKNALFEEGTKVSEKTPNISPELFEKLSKIYGIKPTPEEIFYYIYAVLYSNTYRTKYAEFLKIDFPRIPFTNDYDVFVKMSALGKRLVDLHLLQSSELDPPIAKFQGAGDSAVNKVALNLMKRISDYKGLNERGNRVYINDTQYFEGVTKEVFEYQIGGYQVLSKWLKDRKGRYMTLEDSIAYSKIATSISKTIEIQKEIDTVYPSVETSIS